MATIKKMMYINRTAPHGTVYALEGLEVVLIGAAFEQEVSMAFMDDGVFQLLKGQEAGDTGIKNFSAAYRALGDYDVQKLYVDRASLQERGLTLEDLQHLTYEDEDDDYAEKPSIQLVTSQELAALMDQQDVLFNF